MYLTKKQISNHFGVPMPIVTAYCRLTTPTAPEITQIATKLNVTVQLPLRWQTYIDSAQFAHHYLTNNPAAVAQYQQQVWQHYWPRRTKTYPHLPAGNQKYWQDQQAQMIKRNLAMVPTPWVHVVLPPVFADIQQHGLDPTRYLPDDVLPAYYAYQIVTELHALADAIPPAPAPISPTRRGLHL